MAAGYLQLSWKIALAETSVGLCPAPLHPKQPCSLEESLAQIDTNEYFGKLWS